jgi:hypothetical protein
MHLAPPCPPECATQLPQLSPVVAVSAGTKVGTACLRSVRSMIRGMSPRIIHIPLSGGDRKAQAKGIRHAHGLSEHYYLL